MLNCGRKVSDCGALGREAENVVTEPVHHYMCDDGRGNCGEQSNSRFERNLPPPGAGP
jgi:hypothetical protein